MTFNAAVAPGGTIAMGKRVIGLSGLVFCSLALISPDTAHAYLDPGTGSVLLQGLLAGFAALSAGAGYYWRTLTRLFGKTRGERRHDAG
jgi:hypothetical protein